MPLLNTIVVIIISLMVLLFPVGLVSGIVLAIMISNKKNEPKKAKYTWLMVVSFAGPAVGLFVVISLWGLISVAANSFQ